MQISWERTLPYLSTEISNLLPPAQAEAVLGQRSTYLASWEYTVLAGLLCTQRTTFSYVSNPSLLAQADSGQGRRSIYSIKGLWTQQ